MSEASRKPSIPTRGHWPAGKRRHPDNGDWELVRLGIGALLDEHANRTGISFAALGRACGVTTRAAINWITGVDRPSLESQAVARQWLRELRTAVKKSKS